MHIQNGIKQFFEEFLEDKCALLTQVFQCFIADFWMVYDTEDDESKTSTHRQPPSCILAEMKAKIDIFGSHLPSSSYDLFPNETQAGKKKNTNF